MGSRALKELQRIDKRHLQRRFDWRGVAPTELNPLIGEAAKDLADYQRLTAEGKLGEAGQKLDDLKRILQQLNAGK